jgi:UPF0755 protein
MADGEAFLAFATDPQAAKRYKIPADTLEGYLFPDTYLIPRRITPEPLVQLMLRRFHDRLTPEIKRAAKQNGMTLHQIVILASIIEKETGNVAERRRISGVFHNRLKRGMRLQSDPTVIYGIPDFNGNLTREHLNTKTPYNTYAIDGLPKGPIANPGIASIRAAAFPEETDDLYFVSKNDGTHVFSSTLREHNRAVRRYQKR